MSEIIASQTHGYGFIATSKGDNQRILDRLNTRVKPTDLFTFGLIPEFTGRLPIIARFQDLNRAMLVRIMTEPKNSIYNQFREIFADEGVELTVDPRVFEQIAELAIEYKTGRAQPARHLRGADHADPLPRARRPGHFEGECFVAVQRAYLPPQDRGGEGTGRTLKTLAPRYG